MYRKEVLYDFNPNFSFLKYNFNSFPRGQTILHWVSVYKQVVALKPLWKTGLAITISLSSQKAGLNLQNDIKVKAHYLVARISVDTSLEK